MEWIKTEKFNEEKHGSYFAARMNGGTPERIITVVYVRDGNSSKWWTSYPDGGLRTCGVPDEILVCVG